MGFPETLVVGWEAVVGMRQRRSRPVESSGPVPALSQQVGRKGKVDGTGEGLLPVSGFCQFRFECADGYS